MSVSAAESRSPRKKDESRSVEVAAFWDFTSDRDKIEESERLRQIKVGVSSSLIVAVRIVFGLKEAGLTTLLNASSSTLERRIRDKKPLDSVASERLDRIAAVSHLAEQVFESRDGAAQWMSRPNKALGDVAPIMLCETEIGAKQVRRVLHALEWGGVA
ncbi:type II RES/Xre toxin-antitoxin system antitoxin [Pseudomonas sp. NCHU5208]|uniref:type II RES/Xre toxin-antitoxin system antitoxin n=1 Tax=unclassified Pseudomonas TaxID=196821 RepID=UPI003F9C9BB5